MTTSENLPQKAGQKSTRAGAIGSGLALDLARSIRQCEQPILVVTSDTPSAYRLEKELNFFLSNSERTLQVFPDWEILPYDNFSPHQDIISDRIRALAAIDKGQADVTIIPVSTLLSRMAPSEFVRQRTLILNVGETLNIENFRQALGRYSYRNVPEVLEHGEFSIRGSIIDLFPMGHDTPYRIDLFDDEVDTIRMFDPETQRSEDSVAAINLLPAKEFPVDEDGISRFRRQWRQQMEHSAKDCDVYNQVSEGILPAGIEFYLPLFFEETATLFDYLPETSLVITVGDIMATSEKYWQELSNRYEQRRHDVRRPILKPDSLFLASDELFGNFKRFPRLHIDLEQRDETAFQALPTLAVNHKATKPVGDLDNFIKSSDYPVCLCVESAGRRESLLEMLARHQIKPQVLSTWQQVLEERHSLALVIAPLEDGFISLHDEIAVITENQLFGQRVVKTRQSKKTNVMHENIVRNLAELQLGEAIVHFEQGIGLYRGLQTLDINGQSAEFLTLEYSGGDKLYVPVQSLHLISRYSAGNIENAPLNKLGTENWSKAKRKAAEKVKDVAAELLNIYAKRAAKVGLAMHWPEADYEKFAQSFPFEETEDQESAIKAVLDDLKSGQTMDRLVCGDVGFGKTEVALRAACVSVLAGYQVAVLVPTTLLAQQHAETFKDRFADWPVRVEVLSRFTQPKAQAALKQDLADGKIDIIVGTHKLIQRTTEFANLGLTIIDEEHRFGVKQKETLKALRADVNILNLTATPIPRTLNMSMAGMRDLSIISTPPAKRRAIKTFVREHDDAMVREAVMREIMRGGQVYFLHNEVNTINRFAETLAEKIPEAKVVIAHGQMRERELERVMQDFYHQRYNVLVCTTIIETGIDIPTANTILIDRADKLGLAQLHQLRGRVGRSHHQAYAYLLKPNKRLNKDAEKRLQAIESADDLGAGFTLATHDLEIRGAGELLGEEQSGQIQSLGFNLYMDLLDRAVKALKSGKEPDLDLALSKHSEIELQIPALLPETYLPDVNMRLSFYKRIASAEDDQSLNELQVELIDRFGLLPDAAKNLFALAALKFRATPLGVQKIEANDTVVRVEFTESTPIAAAKLIQLLQLNPAQYRLDGPNRLKHYPKPKDEEALSEPKGRLAFVEALLDTLEGLVEKSEAPRKSSRKRA